MASVLYVNFPKAKKESVQKSKVLEVHKPGSETPKELAKHILTLHCSDAKSRDKKGSSLIKLIDALPPSETGILHAIRDSDKSDPEVRDLLKKIADTSHMNSVAKAAKKAIYQIKWLHMQ